ncbi:MAG: WYL domain-containing protein [Actinomycetaceae bacterium]|nr:WYL domain-containing protein [Actinomycetaceae bacterium]
MTRVKQNKTPDFVLVVALIELLSSGKEYTIQELAHHFSVPKKVIHSLITDIFSIEIKDNNAYTYPIDVIDGEDFPFEEEGVDGSEYAPMLRFQSTDVSLSFSFSELIFLSCVVSYIIDSTQEHFLHQQLVHLHKNVNTLLHRNNYPYFLLESYESTQNSDVYKNVVRSIQERKTLNFDYSTLDSQHLCEQVQSVHNVIPFKIILGKRPLVYAGWSDEKGSYERTYALERMSRVSIGHSIKKKEADALYNDLTFSKPTRSFVQGQRIDIVASLNAQWFVEELDECEWYIDEAKKKLHISFIASNKDFLASSLLALAPHIITITPSDVIDDVLCILSMVRGDAL